MSILHLRTARIGRLAAVAVTAAAALLTAPANAQIGELAGFSEAMQQQYFNRDLLLFNNELELDQAQRDILESLFNDYKDSFQDGLNRMQQRLQEMKSELQAGDQRRILSMIFLPFEEWGEQREQLGDEFLLSVQMILTEQQLETWPAFKRQLLREKTLSKGVLAGESVNLLQIIEQMELPRDVQAGITPVLQEYELALDEALRLRNEVVRRSQSRIISAIQDQNPQATLGLVDDQLARRVQLREVNDRYIDVIAQTLPARYGHEFRQTAMERAYPQAYRDSPSQRMYEAALALESVEADIHASIEALYDAYMDELEVFAEQVVRVIREHEPRKQRMRLEIFTARMTGEEPLNKAPDPILTELRDREEIDERFMSILQGLLTGEQFAELPGAERWLQRRQRSANREAVEQRPTAVRSKGTPPDKGRGDLSTTPVKE